LFARIFLAHAASLRQASYFARLKFRGFLHSFVLRVRILSFPLAGMKIVRHPLKRFCGRRDLHFVTFSCYRRRAYLGTARARNRFVRILNEVRLRHAFTLLAYVVMPEHVHLLIGEPARGNPSKVLQVLKQKVPVLCEEKQSQGAGSCHFLSRPELTNLPPFGNGAFTISTFGARRRC
jgi:REP element-mobilizing transposase RayT